MSYLSFIIRRDLAAGEDSPQVVDQATLTDAPQDFVGSIGVTFGQVVAYAEVVSDGFTAGRWLPHEVHGQLSCLA